MTYEIIILKRARKFIAKQPKPQQEWLLRAISQRPEGDVKQLKGHDGIYRLCVGTYRIIYTIDNGALVITVIEAGNRFIRDIEPSERGQQYAIPLAPKRYFTGVSNFGKMGIGEERTLRWSISWQPHTLWVKRDAGERHACQSAGHPEREGCLKTIHRIGARQRFLFT